MKKVSESLRILPSGQKLWQITYVEEPMTVYTGGGAAYYAGWLAPLSKRRWNSKRRQWAIVRGRHAT